MSQETYGWLSNMVLAGYAKTRRPWWATMAEQEGHTPHLYDGPVPMADVEELMTSWTPEIFPMTVPAFGNPRQRETVVTHKLVRASDDGSHLGVVGIERPTHTYNDWLVGTVKETVREDELDISSCGLLKGRAQGWIQLERPPVLSRPGRNPVQPARHAEHVTGR